MVPFRYPVVSTELLSTVMSIIVLSTYGRVGPNWSVHKTGGLQRIHPPAPEKSARNIRNKKITGPSPAKRTGPRELPVICYALYRVCYTRVLLGRDWPEARISFPRHRPLSF